MTWLKGIGLPELLIVLVLILLVFGVGRIAKVSKELGSGIRSFKEGLQGKEENKEETTVEKEEDKKTS